MIRRSGIDPDTRVWWLDVRDGCWWPDRDAFSWRPPAQDEERDLLSTKRKLTAAGQGSDAGATESSPVLCRS